MVPVHGTAQTNFDSLRNAVGLQDRFEVGFDSAGIVVEFGIAGSQCRLHFLKRVVRQMKMEGRDLAVDGWPGNVNNVFQSRDNRMTRYLGGVVQFGNVTFGQCLTHQTHHNRVRDQVNQTERQRTVCQMHSTWQSKPGYSLFTSNFQASLFDSCFHQIPDGLNRLQFVNVG